MSIARKSGGIGRNHQKRLRRKCFREVEGNLNKVIYWKPTKERVSRLSQWSTMKKVARGQYKN